MIARVIGYKGLAIGSAAINVLVAAAVLSPDLSLFYLSALSFAQVIIPFAGLGVSQKLIVMQPEDAIKATAGRWFLLSFAISVVFFMALYGIGGLAVDPMPAVLIVGLMLLQLIAEWVRVARADQTGFLVFNVALLFVALQILVTGSLDFTFPIPIAGLAILAWRNRYIFAMGSIRVLPDARNLARAVLVASLNQFYNIVIIIVTYLSPTPETLSLVLTYRFAILFNWNSFYWLRFAHKSMAEAISPDHMRQNRRFTALNFILASGVLAAFGIYQVFGLSEFLANANIAADALLAIVVFGFAKSLVNCLFPYEIFMVYAQEDARVAPMLVTAFVSFLLIGILFVTVSKLLAFILLVELVMLAWRLAARRVLDAGK